MKIMAKLWIGLLVLILLSPLGLILPAKFGAGSAWGEWSGDEIRKLVGYLPEGMRHTQGIWNAPMPDYTVRGQESAPIPALSVSYVLSGIIGVAIVVGIAFLIGKVLARHDDPDAP